MATLSFLTGHAASSEPPPEAAYRAAFATSGPLTEPDRGQALLRFRSLLSPTQRLALSLLVTASATASLSFIIWLCWPTHWPPYAHRPEWAEVGSWVAFAVLVIQQALQLIQTTLIWVFMAHAQDPVPLPAKAGLRVAMVTTIVPSREPVGLAAQTLEAMRRVRYDGPIDVWILDEGDDPQVREVARHLGVHHFSRKGRPEYNQPSGAFRARTKAGNHNAWASEHAARYDIVAVLDTDHIPEPMILERTVGYFRDPDVAFVTSPQVYRNLRDGFIPHAAAQSQYLFNAMVQRGGNGLRAPLLVGTNHVYRVTALRSIGGFRDSIVEDHLTAMHLYAQTNTETGKAWKGVATPDVLAVGEAPATWTDYFRQQMRWCTGNVQIATRHSPRLLARLGPRQGLAFLQIQLFYPLMATVWLLGVLLALAYLLGGIRPISNVGLWIAPFWGLVVGSTLALLGWARRFYLADHERRELGLKALVIFWLTLPVYVAATVGAMVGRTLDFSTTAKGHLASRDRLGTFRPHLLWLGIVGVGLVAGLALGHTGGLLVWPMLSLLLLAIPIAWHLLTPKRPRPSGDPAMAPVQMAEVEAN